MKDNNENKFILSFRKHFVAYLVTFIIATVIGVAIFLLIFFLGPSKMTIIGALDGVTIASLVALGIAGLAFVANQGMFDSLTYGFGQLTTAMFNKKANKYNDYTAYLDKKRVVRANSAKFFMAILFASIPFVIATLILFILTRTLF